MRLIIISKMMNLLDININIDILTGKNCLTN